MDGWKQWFYCPYSSMDGDPIVHFGGRAVQIWVPTGELIKLIAVGKSALFGMSTLQTSNNDQWFDKFRMDLESIEVVHISVKTGLRDNSQMRRQGHVNVQSSNTSMLQTLNLIVDQNNHIDTVGTMTARDGQVRLEVQHLKKQIGPQQEAVLIETPDLDVKVFSSVAAKYKTEQEQLRFTHLDLSIVKVSNALETFGVLPEIWGLKVMSQETQAMLGKHGSKESVHV